MSQIRSCFKTNFNGALFTSTNEAGISVAVCNYRGKVMTTMFKEIPMPAYVVLLEMLAAWRVVIFVHDLNLNNSIFEDDSEMVVNALSHVVTSLSFVTYLVKDTTSIVGFLVCHLFSYIRQQSNVVAHTLVRRVRHSSPLLVQMESISLNIFSYVISDFFES